MKVDRSVYWMNDKPSHFSIKEVSNRLKSLLTHDDEFSNRNK